MKVYCPHCKHVVEIDEFKVGELVNDDFIIEDYMCPECKKMMDIEVDGTYGRSYIARMETCDYCGKEVRVNNIYHRDAFSPFPVDGSLNKMCGDCLSERIQAESNKRLMYLNHVSVSDIKYLSQKYKNGTKLHVDHIKDPYKSNMRNFDATVDHIDEHGAIYVCIPNGMLFELLDGYDAFSIIKEDET